MNRVDVQPHRRQQIISAAQRLLARKGWAATTFADICKEANVSNGVLTYHFKDKDDILFAVLERTSSEAQEHLLLALQSQQPLQDKLALAVRNEVACTQQSRELCELTVHFLSLATSRPEIAQRLEQMYTTSRQHLQAEIEQALALGQMKSRDPESVAALLQMLFMGISFGFPALGLTLPTERLIEEVVFLLRSYLEVEPQAHTLAERTERQDHC